MTCLRSGAPWNCIVYIKEEENPSDKPASVGCPEHFTLVHRTLAFQAGTANKFSLTDSNEGKNLIGTPELKTYFSLLGTIF